MKSDAVLNSSRELLVTPILNRGRPSLKSDNTGVSRVLSPDSQQTSGDRDAVMGLKSLELRVRVKTPVLRKW